jgi:hypothetical protein
MIDPTEKDIGRGVIYCQGKPWQESGVITSFNPSFVFVRYGSSRHGVATKREDLVYELPQSG